jgi:hypothetical protein
MVSVIALQPQAKPVGIFVSDFLAPNGRKSGFEQVGFPINTALQRGAKQSPTHQTVSTVFFCRNPNRPGSR